MRRKKRKRLVRDRVAELQLTGPNQEWAMDFVTDGLSTGRKSSGGQQAVRMWKAKCASHIRTASTAAAAR